jgi:tetratricopeptide (TPR) repeat protein
LLTQALQLAPGDGMILHNRGMAFASLQRWHESLADFNRAIALDPQPTTYEQRGLVHYHIGNRQAARQDWEQTLHLNPRRTLALGNLGWLSLEDRNFRQAIEYFNRIINIEPTFAKAYENRAKAHFEMGSLTEARADLTKARALIDSGQDTSNKEQYD